MSRIARLLLTLFLSVCAADSGYLQAAENRVPTPDEFRELVRRHNESGGGVGLQRPPQPPKSVEQFNRAVALHTKKDASARDLKEAASLYQSASDAGIPQATTNLALLYLDGKGVKKDAKKAVSLLNKASSMNETQADLALARLYLNGIDVKRDEKKGEALLSKAVKAGNQNAVKMQAEYREWKKKNELAMKEYQELLKKVQLNQVKPGGSLQPLQVIPQQPAMTTAAFPVIPGYTYLADRKAPIPDFTAAPRQASPQEKTGTSPLQPISVVPMNSAADFPLKIEAVPDKAGLKP